MHDFQGQVHGQQCQVSEVRMASRFASSTQQEIEKLHEDKDSENTKRSTKVAKELFYEYLKEKNYFLQNNVYKTIIRIGFCDIRNNQGLGKCYQPQPLADNTYCTSTLIIPDITKTSSNNCLLAVNKLSIRLISGRLSIIRDQSSLKVLPKVQHSYSQSNPSLVNFFFSHSHENYLSP